MKKYIYTLLFAVSIILGACSEDKLDSNSIFSYFLDWLPILLQLPLVVSE